MSRVCIYCPNSNCHHYQASDRLGRGIILRGKYKRACDGEWVQRYECKACGKRFSNQTFNSTYYQHKPRINGPVRELLCASTSQRRIAKILKINKDTVARRVRWLADKARKSHAKELENMNAIDSIQFDEMETFEKSKCLPVSIALAVDTKTRRILVAEPASMPAKGPLAKISLKKYGPRKDERRKALIRLLQVVKKNLAPHGALASDCCPRYPHLVKKYLPNISYSTYLGRRGCVVGQGELKATGKDPLFALNHAAAMIRDDIKRLGRRTWCTTKKINYLADILMIYIEYRNEKLIKKAC